MLRSHFWTICRAATHSATEISSKRSPLQPWILLLTVSLWSRAPMETTTTITKTIMMASRVRLTTNTTFFKCRAYRHPPSKLSCPSLKTSRWPSEGPPKGMKVAWIKSIDNLPIWTRKLNSQSRWIMSHNASAMKWTYPSRTSATIKTEMMTRSLMMKVRRLTLRGAAKNRLTRGATWRYWIRARSRLSTSHLLKHRKPSAKQTALTIVSETQHSPKYICILK